MNVSPFVSALARPATEPVLHHDSAFAAKLFADFEALAEAVRRSERPAACVEVQERHLREEFHETVRIIHELGGCKSAPRLVPCVRIGECQGLDNSRRISCCFGGGIGAKESVVSASAWTALA